MLTPLPYQKKPVEKLTAALLRGQVACDESDTGVGKTYVAAMTAKALGIPVRVVCPLAVVPAWRDVLTQAEVEDFDIITYNKLCFANTYGRWSETAKAKKVPDGYRSPVEGAPKRGGAGVGRTFYWECPVNSLIIFDEAHRLRDAKTKSAKAALCAAWAKTEAGLAKYRILMLSATLATNPLHMKIIGTICRLFPWRGYDGWCYEHGVRKIGTFQKLFCGKADDLERIYSKMEPYTVRTRCTDAAVLDHFRENRVDFVKVPTTAEALKEYEDAMKAYVEACNLAEGEKDRGTTMATAQLRVSQQLELLKLPSIIDLTVDAVEAGKSVVVYLRFTETIYQLKTALSKRKIEAGIFDGKVGEDVRRKAQSEFNENRLPIIIVQTSSGGVGLSLHDTIGDHPRYTLITSMQSATMFTQILGRVHRSGMKSACSQHLLLSEGTIEDKIARNLRNDMNNLEALLGDRINKQFATEKNSTISSKPENPLINMNTINTIDKPELADHKSRGHAEFSPSALKHFMHCPGWRSIPGTSEAADRGTACHEALQNILEHLDDWGAWVRRDEFYTSLDTEQKDLCNKCLGVVGQLDKPETKEDLILEASYDIKDAEGNEVTHGSADFLYLQPAQRTAILVDWKFGKWAVDHAEHNLQGIAYACGVLQKYENIDWVRVIFLQPGADDPDNPGEFWAPDTWIARHELSRLVLFIKSVVDNARADAVRRPCGDCKFCNRKLNCPAVLQQKSIATDNITALSEFNKEEFEFLKTPFAEWTAEQRGKALDLAKAIGVWTDAVTDAVKFAIEHGETVPGWSMTKDAVTLQFNPELLPETLKFLAEEYDCYEDNLKQIGAIKLDWTKVREVIGAAGTGKKAKAVIDQLKPYLTETVRKGYVKKAKR